MPGAYGLSERCLDRPRHSDEWTQQSPNQSRHEEKDTERFAFFFSLSYIPTLTAIHLGPVVPVVRRNEDAPPRPRRDDYFGGVSLRSDEANARGVSVPRRNDPPSPRSGDVSDDSLHDDPRPRRDVEETSGGSPCIPEVFSGKTKAEVLRWLVGEGRELVLQAVNLINAENERIDGSRVDESVEELIVSSPRPRAPTTSESVAVQVCILICILGKFSDF